MSEKEPIKAKFDLAECRNSADVLAWLQHQVDGIPVHLVNIDWGAGECAFHRVEDPTAAGDGGVPEDPAIAEIAHIFREINKHPAEVAAVFHGMADLRDYLNEYHAEDMAALGRLAQAMVEFFEVERPEVVDLVNKLGEQLTPPGASSMASTADAGGEVLQKSVEEGGA